MLQQLILAAIRTGLNGLSIIAPNIAGQRAVQLFRRPRSGRLRPKDESFLATAEQTDTLSTKYGTIQSYSWNTKAERSIMLFHGWESNSARWRFLIPLLVKQNWQVHCIDAPAHGSSSNKFFDMLQYGEAIHIGTQHFQPHCLLGHSVGGATLAYYLSHYTLPPLQRIVLLGVPGTLRQMIQGFKDALGMSSRSQQVMDDAFEGHFQKSIDYFSTVDFCKRIQLPTLLVHDKQDKITPVAGGQACYEALPQGELMLTDGLGHSLQDQTVYDRIITYLAPVQG